MNDVPLTVRARVDGADLPLTLYKRVSGTDVLLTPFIRKSGTPAPVPNPGEYTITDMLTDDPFYIAHRCGGLNWPEFSPAGVSGSLSRGYKALEVSVYQCATGEFVCSHDWTTERMTGVRHEIHATPWSTLSTLTQTAANTTDPSQPRQPLMRLTDVLALAGDRVLFIDHKPTSGGPGNTADTAAMNNLLDFLETIPDATDHIVWKTFKGGYQAAQAARARGFKTWGIYYTAEITTAPDRLSDFDYIGLDYNAAQSYWNVAVATGKPTIAHIITTISARDAGLSRGADGFMNSNVAGVGP